MLNILSLNLKKSMSLQTKKHDMTWHCDPIEKEHSDDIQDLFQFEIIEGEELDACNVCNEGFEKEGEIKKHIDKY